MRSTHDWRRRQWSSTAHSSMAVVTARGLCCLHWLTVHSPRVVSATALLFGNWQIHWLVFDKGSATGIWEERYCHEELNWRWSELNCPELSWTELEVKWTELSWTELYWTVLSWAELSWTELEVNWTVMNWAELNWTGGEVNWTVLKWTELYWNELNWTVLNWAELNCTELS